MEEHPVLCTRAGGDACAWWACPDELTSDLLPSVILNRVPYLEQSYVPPSELVCSSFSVWKL